MVTRVSLPSPSGSAVLRCHGNHHRLRAFAFQRRAIVELCLYRVRAPHFNCKSSFSFYLMLSNNLSYFNNPGALQLVKQCHLTYRQIPTMLGFGFLFSPSLATRLFVGLLYIWCVVVHLLRCCTFVARRTRFCFIFIELVLLLFLYLPRCKVIEKTPRSRSVLRRWRLAVVDSSSINMFLTNSRNKDFEEKVT